MMILYQHHRELLTNVLLELLDKRLIEHPYQVAIGKLDVIKKIGRYEFFSIDAIPVLNYMHPLLLLRSYDDDQNVYVRQLQTLENVENVFASTPFFEIKPEIKRNYEILRSLEFPESVSSEFYNVCLKNNKSLHGECLTDNILKSFVEDNPQKKILCDLENALFLWGNNSFYLCVFYNYDMTIHENYVFHFIVFCIQRNSSRIGVIVKDEINKFKHTSLLEYLEISGGKIKIIVEKIYQQLNENITSNSLNAENRNDWAIAKKTFDEKKVAFFSETADVEKLRDLLIMLSSQPPNSFIGALNNIK